jgi:cell division protein FtsZ
VQAPSYAQVDLYDQQPASTPAEPERATARAAEPERPAAREVEDAPLFPDRPIGGEERHHGKGGGWLSLFGGRRQAEPPPPLRDYRNDPTPVLQARSQTQAAPAPSPIEDDHMDAGDELEIPSFLRRLAN